MTYQQQLLTKEWKEKAESIRKRDGYKCVQCDSVGPLEVHHTHYNFNWKAWEYPDNSLITLCRTCHEEVHKTWEKRKRKEKAPARSNWTLFDFNIAIENFTNKIKKAEVEIVKRSQMLNTVQNNSGSEFSQKNLQWEINRLQKEITRHKNKIARLTEERDRRKDTIPEKPVQKEIPEIVRAMFNGPPGPDGKYRLEQLKL